MSEQNHIEFNNVTVRYGDDIALDDLDFKVKHNSIFGVVGPANSGKTTMLKCINRTIDFISSAMGAIKNPSFSDLIFASPMRLK